ncbi:MAG: serine hydrolase family protein [Proteobacteria bacterium]|jgi:predicted alpha/beta hydrolase family esterase|nr:serine hydrolase family protein [Pseudomonadota bacterium]
MNGKHKANPDQDGPQVLLLPGWLNSGPEHWQSRWEALHGHRRVEQDDWLWPRRGDWMARLDEVLLGSAQPVLLAAHSLGCQLVAAWAAHSAHTGRVAGALLVAPPDTEREDMPPNLFNWRPIPREKLPFASVAVVSSDDPYCAPPRAQAMAGAWGSELVEIGARGHINGESGLGDWPQGITLLERLGGRSR